MHEHLTLIVGERTENHARMMLQAGAASGIAEIIGVACGPYCDFAKTLTADFTFKPKAGSVEALLIEPCYWTPQLPFWYDLRLRLLMQDGSERQEVVPVGLRRWYCDGRDFRLESKRVVLRGLRHDSPTKNDLQHAREFETVLVVDNPTAEVCQSASRIGVPLVADLRDNELSWDEVFRQLDWSPAVLLLLLSVDQLKVMSDAERPRQSFVAVRVGANDPQPAVKCDVYTVELASDERPPIWLATCGKPVIAIRKEAASEISTARAGCDRLQTELAPEFDLAGYFV
ncbi:MAG: hypothetical protein SH868_01925 [Bythopirellula sp.]|nr:hypothetical protein [Bythopirellula sp.]